MSFSQGFDDARKDIAAALAIIAIIVSVLLAGMIFNSIYTIFSSTKTPMGEYIDVGFRETFNALNAFLNSLVFILSLIGTFGVIETLSKAVNDPEWGIGYAAGLAIISPLAILVVFVLLSEPYVPQLKGLLSFVDPSGEMMAAATGTILGLVMHFIKKRVQSELEDSYYWL